MAGLRRDACDAIRREARKVGQGCGLEPCLIHLSAKQLSSHLPRPAVPAWSTAPPQNAAQMDHRPLLPLLGPSSSLAAEIERHSRTPPAGWAQKTESEDGCNPRVGVRVWMVANSRGQN